MGCEAPMYLATFSDWQPPVIGLSEDSLQSPVTSFGTGAATGAWLATTCVCRVEATFCETTA